MSLHNVSGWWDDHLQENVWHGLGLAIVAITLPLWLPLYALGWLMDNFDTNK